MLIATLSHKKLHAVVPPCKVRVKCGCQARLRRWEFSGVTLARRNGQRSRFRKATPLGAPHIGSRVMSGREMWDDLLDYDYDDSGFGPYSYFAHAMAKDD